MGKATSFLFSVSIDAAPRAPVVLVLTRLHKGFAFLVDLGAGCRGLRRVDVADRAMRQRESLAALLFDAADDEPGDESDEDDAAQDDEEDDPSGSLVRVCIVDARLGADRDAVRAVCVDGELNLSRLVIERSDIVAHECVT